tara:strand:- start:88 stop:384 length:297 start_codon:yes stop_codon:yes gene_type:complete
MTYDLDAIIRAYPNASSIDSERGAFDSSGNKLSLDQSKIDTARAELNAEYEATKYRSAREKAYASIGDQLDMQYHDAVNGTTTWKDHVAKVKSDNPKP